MALTVGVDIGGTKIAAGVVDERGRLLAHGRVPTPVGGADVGARIADAVAEAVQRVRGGHEIVAIGVGAAGFVDAARSTVLFAPNVAWEADEPLRERIEKRVGLPVVVENDVNAAAWGEARFGAGRGEPDLACIAIGTGIGGGLIMDGGLYRGRFGVAGEFGHLRVVVDGRPCACGGRGCWEAYASGTALVRDAREAVEADPEVGRALLDLAGGSTEQVTGPMVMAAAQAGDPLAVRLFDGLGHWIGSGLATLAAVVDPGCFVIGGGVGTAGDLLLTPTVRAFRELLPGRGHRPEPAVRLAELGNEAAIVGAADLARTPGD